MSKRHIAYRNYYCVLFAVLFLSVFCYGTEVVARESSLSAASEKVLKTIAERYIRQAFENAQSFEEAASEIGVSPDELRDLCSTLKIDIDFPSKEVESVPVTSLEKLAGTNFEAGSILKI